MKPMSLILMVLLTAALVTPPSATAGTTYEFKEAAQLNALYSALGGDSWSQRSGWPLPVGPQSQIISFPLNLSFRTVTRTVGNDTKYEYYVVRIELNGIGCRGQMPSTIAFDSLEAFVMGWDTLVVGNFPVFTSQNLREIMFSAMRLSGQLPDYSYPLLQRLTISNTRISGNIPALTLPNATYVMINGNKNLNGTLGKLTAPKLRELDITFNDSLGGELFPLDFPEIERLYIRYNRYLAGSISSLSFPNATYVTIDGCIITGPLPQVDLPKAEYFSVSNNRLTGSIGALNLPLARVVLMDNNQFNGTMAAQVLPACVEFSVARNKLTGDLPALTMPKCSTIAIHTNEFTGSIAPLDLPMATSISASDNKLSGTLPTAWKSAAIISITLTANRITGPIPAWTLPELQSLVIDHNQLTGPISVLNAPKLRTFYVYKNKLSGTFPTLSMPELVTLGVDSNRLTDLPDIKSTCPKLTAFSAQANKLTFAAMERNVSFGSTAFLRQDSVVLFSEKLPDNRTRFFVKVDGSANHYMWQRLNADGSTYWYSGDDNDTLIVPAGEGRLHFCQIRSDKVSGVTLFSGMHPGESTFPNPWVKGMLSFYAEGSDGWEVDADKPVISYTGRVIVNGFLNFEGTISIDTEAVSVSANGLFSLKDVPLPLGGTGTFVLCEGTYSLKLLGGDGSITNFANSQFKKLASIAGVKFELTNIKLLGGLEANGVSIDGKMEIAGLANGCSEGEPGPSKIEFEGLAYSRKDGPSLDAIKIEDLGFASFPKFCLKRLEAKYEKDKDKLSFGASVAMPYAEVSGGIAMILDKVDSIAWRLEATEHAVPIGQTNMGMSGFYGSISGIQSTPLDVELGGIFGTMVPQNFVKFDAAGTYTAPATLGLKIDGSAVPTPGEDDQYQLKLAGSIKYDFAEGMAHLEGESHVGTIDGEEYFIDGSFKMDIRTQDVAIKGELTGGYQIKAVGAEDKDEYPYDWINAKLGLPKKVTTEARFVFIKSRVVYGVAHLGGSMGDINYVFDFHKNWNDPDFLYWSRTPAKEELAGNDVQGIQTTRTVVIAPNTTRMVVRVKGASTLPTSTLTMPDGTVITGTNAGRQIDYTAVTASNKAFWTILEPTTGRWLVNIPTAGANDVIEIFVDELPAPFQITTSQQQRSVTVTWTPRGTIDDSVGFFVAGTGTSADGLPLGAASLLAGTATINLPNDLPVCSFNVEAQGTEGMNIIADTSATQISVTMGTVTTPSMMIARYYTSQHLLNITWTPSAVSDTKVKSYVVVARNNGKERLLGEVFRWVGWVSVPYTRQNGDKVYVRGVDASGRMGCPTEITQITTDVAEEPSTPTNGMMIVPHPVDQRSEVRFVNTSSGPTSIIVTDLQGRSVMTVFNGWLDAGPNVIGLDASNVPSGMYVVTVRGNNDVQQVPMVVAH